MHVQVELVGVFVEQERLQDEQPVDGVPVIALPDKQPRTGYLCFIWMGSLQTGCLWLACLLSIQLERSSRISLDGALQ